MAKRLRRNQTEAERKLWLRLRNRRLNGLKFKRQVPVSRFIADFLCEDCRLIIEIDGGQHGEQVKEDTERTRILQDAGFQVMRFWNSEVMTNIEGVLEQIAEMAALAGDKTERP